MIHAAYLHIPFCHHICHYCDFNKVFFENQPVEQYLEAVNKEMETTMENFPTDYFKTIFVGGGTPTALTEEQLEVFLQGVKKYLPFDEETEYTFEANPNELTVEKLQLMKKYGVNRLSIGVQTFNEELLKKIGRVHTNSQVEQVIAQAKEHGFHNISIDLMYNLPGQTMEDFKQSIEKAVSLNVPHISSYSLIVEPKTVFYNLHRKGKLHLLPQEKEAEMYEYLMDILASEGYEQYEISNFAKKGFESKHNLTYWENNEYFGIGAGAHGYMNEVRRANAGPLKKYIHAVEEKGHAYIEEHKVTEAEKMEEEMFLGLRKGEGVNKAIFETKFSRSMDSIFHEQIEDLKKRGLLEEDKQSVFLTRQGKLLGNEVFSQFIGVI
ncbi:radical SAM family heme chaperone HemW [Priestia endophytica]|jgi:putative oxygen-independent coproporphyrinogen III oxidase|uniref:radical SAM family heme chaperone HemW n=1 Tax=Priestia endophytica TaxID=135735 RepID=UPI000DCA9685|nr:radical SAM family heme chaperone HemW [Priestia endophytica]KAB2493533.1 oxygen-independent coproporphyrinogen III oxidase [Priestia endophytica]RAS83033.1 coproporphyrinogen III oxidase [Priestia endophytica]